MKKSRWFEFLMLFSWVMHPFLVRFGCFSTTLPLAYDFWVHFCIWECWCYFSRVKSFSNDLTIVYFLSWDVFCTNQPSLFLQSEKCICNFCFHGWMGSFFCYQAWRFCQTAWGLINPGHDLECIVNQFYLLLLWVDGYLWNVFYIFCDMHSSHDVLFTSDLYWSF